MNIERFITKRLIFNKERSFSKFIIRIAIAAVALSMAVMILTISLVSGFQKEITDKIFGFWGHIHITEFGIGKSEHPISINQVYYPHLDTLPEIKHIQVFAYKAGIIKTEDQIEGLVLKGVSSDFDWDFLNSEMESGKVLDVSKATVSSGILISSYTARRLNLKVGDKALAYFIQNPPRYRQLEIEGIYNTGLEEYDKMYALVDLRHIQQLNDWEEHMVGGFEVFLENPSELERISEYILYDVLGYDQMAQTIKEVYPNIFDWLELQNMNELIIILLMIAVAAINMITCLLILILDRTRMIGILKALGANNFQIRKIFLYQAAYILGFGMLAGNLLGIGIALLQMHFQFIQLDEASYYVSYAPVNLNILHLLLLNISTFLLCLLFLLLPSFLVAKIAPVRAIRVD
ncbi:MAG: FtsX-like permease family protein [Chitinophagales bacterium]